MGRFRRLRAASDFANSGKVTKAPFRNLRFLKISLRKPLSLACPSHPARGCKSKNKYFLRPLPLVVRNLFLLCFLVYMARLPGALGNGGRPHGATPSSSQAPYRSLPPDGESSLIPLLRLSPPNPRLSPLGFGGGPIYSAVVVRRGGPACPPGPPCERGLSPPRGGDWGIPSTGNGTGRPLIRPCGPPSPQGEGTAGGHIGPPLRRSPAASGGAPSRRAPRRRSVLKKFSILNSQFHSTFCIPAFCILSSLSTLNPR